MYGISYAGSAHFMAASAHPPHLKAIFPEMAVFDLYDLCYPGGIYRHTLMNGWQQQIQTLDLSQGQRVAPMDQDKDLRLLAQAIGQLQDNFDVCRATEIPFRDGFLPREDRVYIDNSPATYIEKVNTFGVAVYQRAGWLDMYPRDMLSRRFRTPFCPSIGENPYVLTRDSTDNKSRHCPDFASCRGVLSYEAYGRTTQRFQDGIARDGQEGREAQSGPDDREVRCRLHTPTLGRTSWSMISR